MNSFDGGSATFVEQIYCVSRALLEGAPQGILAADKDSRILLVNSQLEDMFGFNRGELVGDSAYLLGTAKLESVLIILLDLNRVLSVEETSAIKELALAA